jgi:glycosyltransferase involved in cell wall biosynthesis
MPLSLTDRLISKLRCAFASFDPPPDWDEEGYLLANPDVKAAVERGALRSGFEHWQRRGRLERRNLVPPTLPKWLEQEMYAISEFEPMLFPSLNYRLSALYTPMKTNGAGAAYGSLLRQAGEQSFTHVFLLPWFKTGGADLVSLHHIRTLAGEFGARILVVLTENTDSPWLSRLPESVTAVHFGAAAAGLDSYQAEIVLARFLLKLQPAVIHNMNSAIAWRLFALYGAALSSGSRLFVSLYCFDYSVEGEPVGYARELEKVYPYVSGVFSDNSWFPTKLHEIYGVDPGMFSVMRYPVRVAPRFVHVPDSRPKILWAGRLDRQKRPDILQRIATSLPEVTFHIYGTCVLDHSPEIAATYTALSRMENVVLFGAYDGFDSIPAQNYSLLLYTTAWDGMPNVVLEALAAGLPVIAPDVGGISEVIAPDSGFLIDRFDDVEAYVTAISRVTANPRLLADEREKRLDLLRRHYTPEAFAAALAAREAYSLVASPDRRQIA